MSRPDHVWRVLDAFWINDDPTYDVIAISLQASGREYVVACSGPKGMNSNDFIPAVRAAAASLIRAVGGDMSVVNACDINAVFDTGDQRAN
jgi:hypothetical protein